VQTDRQIAPLLEWPITTICKWRRYKYQGPTGLSSKMGKPASGVEEGFSLCHDLDCFFNIDCLLKKLV
jgi:hypothetical protein